MRRVEWEERGCFSAATEAPSGSGSATRLIGYDLINVSLRKRNISKFEVSIHTHILPQQGLLPVHTYD